jgi:hypothetical protein
MHACMTLHTYGTGPARANTATYLRTLKQMFEHSTTFVSNEVS